MGKTFLPDRDSDLCKWAGIAAERLLATPGAYGVSSELANEFGAAQRAFADSLSKTQFRGTRTMIDTARKNEDRKILRALAGEVSAVVQANRHVTREQILELGLTLRKNRARVAPPDEVPGVNATAENANVVSVKLLRTNSDKRGKPQRAAMANIFAAYPDAPGLDPVWRLIGATSRPVSRWQLPHRLPAGTPVVLRAQWVNTRQEPGPMSFDAFATLRGGGMRDEAATPVV